jgi:hypothetical protein
MRKSYPPWGILALWLMVAEPIGLSFYASSIVTSVIDRGAAAVLLLAARLIITAVGVAAGLALWRQRPGAASFARIALAATAAGVLATFLLPVLPRNRPPGTAGPILLALLTYYGAWFAYLTRLERRA